MSKVNLLGLMLQLALAILQLVRRQQLKAEVRNEYLAQLWREVDEVTRSASVAWSDIPDGGVDVQHDEANRDNWTDPDSGGKGSGTSSSV